MTYRAKHPFSGTGDQTIKFPEAANWLVLVNDSNSEIQFARQSIYQPFSESELKFFPLKPGEVFDDLTDYFDAIVIKASGKYRGFVRRSDDEQIYFVGTNIIRTQY